MQRLPLQMSAAHFASLRSFHGRRGDRRSRRAARWTRTKDLPPQTPRLDTLPEASCGDGSKGGTDVNESSSRAAIHTGMFFWKQAPSWGDGSGRSAAARRVARLLLF
jgi:hypothetical protein